MNIKARPQNPYFTKPPTPTHKKSSPFFTPNSTNNGIKPLRLPSTSSILYRKQSTDKNYRTECLGNSPQLTERAKGISQRNIPFLEFSESPSRNQLEPCEAEKNQFFHTYQNQENENKKGWKNPLRVIKQNDDGFYTPRSNVRKPSSATWVNANDKNQEKTMKKPKFKKQEQIYEIHSILSEQISHRLQQIEGIMDQQNINLRQHNSYLIEIIRKSQFQERKNKAKMLEYQKNEQKLKKQNKECHEKIAYLQSLLRNNIQPPQHQKQQNQATYFANKTNSHTHISKNSVCDSFYPKKARQNDKFSISNNPQSYNEDSVLTLHSFLPHQNRDESIDSCSNNIQQRRQRRITPFFLDDSAQELFSKQLSKQNQPEYEIPFGVKVIQSEEDEDIDNAQTEESILQGLQQKFEEYLHIYKHSADGKAKQRCLQLMKKIKALNGNRKIEEHTVRNPTSGSKKLFGK